MTETVGRHAAAVWDCSFSPDGTFFATASRDRTVKLWDTESGTDVTTLRGHDGEVGACEVAPNARFVVSAGDDGLAYVWMLGGMTLPEGVEVPGGHAHLVMRDQIPLLGHQGNVLGCAVSPDARCVVTASDDQRLKLWETHSGREVASLRGHGGPVFDCVVSPDGATIVSASFDKTVMLWDVASRSARASLVHPEPVVSCAISPDGAFVVSGCLDSTVKVFDLSEEVLTTLGRHDGPVLSCAVGPDASFAASAGADATLRLWDARERSELAAVSLTSALQCVALHPHAPLALCGDHAGGVHVIDLVGVEYGPLPIAAIDADDRPGDPVILCPKCRSLLDDSARLLGTDLRCPGCGVELRINARVASTPALEPAPPPAPLLPGMSPEDAAIMDQFRAAPPPGRPPDAPTPKRRRLWRKRR
jgi:WD40 repeat protein